MVNQKSDAYLHRVQTALKLVKLLFAATLALLLLLPPNSFLSSTGLTAVTSAQSSPNPPCPFPYGSDVNQIIAIEEAMFSGTAAEVTTAINNAKNNRGDEVGCQETCVDYAVSNFTEPSLSAIVERWNTIHAPGIAGYAETCPTLGRKHSPAALGGYYARLAGYSADLNKLANIANIYEAQQYKNAYAPEPLTTYAGVFGFLNEAGACDPIPPGSPGVDFCGNPTVPQEDPIEKICDLEPSVCVTYDSGTFAGRNFLVADIIPEGKDGGMAYDQGWAGVMMIEAKINQPSQSLKNKFKESARLAADWAIAEPPVRNHNYTAKLVWLLAQAYGLSGEAKYKTALMDKFNRNLKPGVLMDLNGDGKVDGMNNQPFSGLTTVAQRPGRMWDGHNSRPTYHPMNAWALVEAYVALRDRGNTAEAAQVKPYAVAMLDNLAWEINTLGVPKIPNQTQLIGSTQIPHALMLGLWKIVAYEPGVEPHQDEWEQAAWAMWNAGIGNSYGDNTVNVGLYLLYKNGVPYVPLKQRREIYQPAAYSILVGSAGSGNLASLYNDDNNYLVAGNNANPAISVDYQITQTTLTRLRILVRSKDSASSGVTRRLYIWNKTTSNWVQIGYDSIGTSETTASVNLTSGLSDYVNNGVIKIGVEHDGSGTASHMMSVETMGLGVNE